MQIRNTVTEKVREIVLEHAGDIIITFLLLYSLSEPLKELAWPDLCIGLIIRSALSLVGVVSTLAGKKNRYVLL